MFVGIEKCEGIYCQHAFACKPLVVSQLKRTIIILLFGLLAFGLGWWTNEMTQFAEGVNADTKKRDSTVKDNQARDIYASRTKFKRVSEFTSDKDFIHWFADHSDKAKYMCEITFHSDYSIYWFHGQCQYYFFSNKTSDSTIDLLWAYKTDCILDLDFLNKPNRKIKTPKSGDSFVTFTLTNDSTLKANYNFPEWVREINKTANDSIFPTYLYCRPS